MDLRCGDCDMIYVLSIPRHRAVSLPLDLPEPTLTACVLAVLRYPDQGLETLSAPLTVEPVGIAVPASELSLQSLLDNYLHAFEDSGLLELLRVQWLENGDWVAELP